MNSAVPEIRLHFVAQRERRLVGFLLRFLLVAAAIPLMISGAVKAQTVEASVASVSGQALLSGNSRSSAEVPRGVILIPGDVIDTRGGGRVTVQLSDGSLVTIQPGSIVTLEDYRNAGSLRELLKIAVGRLRVRINHFGGRPNPYRVNSPTASIAVRGTEFSVSVSAAGDTEVVVYEGLVDVSSISHPLKHLLVGAGHGVIVRANDDVQFFIAGPSNEIGERRNNVGEHDQDSRDELDQTATTSKTFNDSQRTASGVYERYFNNIVEDGETPLPSRFAAFPDSHFDSLENPAYATEFSAFDGRLFFLPSMGGTRENERARELFGLGNPSEVDYSLSPQGSLFVPIAKLRTVIGGRVVFSRDGFQSVTLDDNALLTGRIFVPGTIGSRSVDGTTTNRLFSASFVAARRFGNDARTSVGIGLDYFATRGRLSNTIVQSDNSGLRSTELVTSRSAAGRTRFVFGVTHDFDRGRKLGLFYRYGITSAEDRERSRVLNGGPRRLNKTSEIGNSSELGFTFRAPLSRRLFYGVEGSYLAATTSESARRSGVVDSLIKNRAQRTTFGLGIGYVMRPGTVLSFDATAGMARINDVRNEKATTNLLENENKRAFFVSFHSAIQADVWRRLFVSGSLLSITQARTQNLTLYPDRFGRIMSGDGIFENNGRTHDRFTDYFSNLGLGWRFNRNFLAEYVFSTDFGQTSPRHTFLLRYTFSRSEKSHY